MTSRPKRSRNYSVSVRRRPYIALVIAHDSNTSNTRDTLVTPSKGTRIRLLRARVIQEQPDGRRLLELYFGVGANISTNADKSVDIIEVPNQGEASTRTFLRDEGPRGLRDEVLSGRWLGAAPTKVHKIIIEYTEEP